MGVPYKNRPFHTPPDWWLFFGATWSRAWECIDKIQLGRAVWYAAEQNHVRRFFSDTYFYEIPEWAQWTIGWVACLHHIRTRKRKPFEESLKWAVEVSRRER